MKSLALSTIGLMLVSMGLWSQDQSSSRQDQGQQQQQQQQAPQRRPTLGPSTPAPSLGGGGAKTASTTDPRKLARVHKIYIERMDNALNEKLTAALSKVRRFEFVGEPKHADAILNGTCFDSRRLKVLRSEVYLHDTAGSSIWQDSVRRPINPPSIDAAATETAELIATHLTESLTEAERH